METYICYHGVVGQSPATDYKTLLDMEYEERPDDDLIVYTIARDQDCSWNEGVCPCGGIMRWAEAGYVPWHRICDRCGAHWELHPVTVYLRQVPEAKPANIPPGEGREINPEVRRRREAVLRLLAGSMNTKLISPEEATHGAIYGSWAQRARIYRG